MNAAISRLHKCPSKLNLLWRTNASIEKLSPIFNPWLETDKGLSGSSRRAPQQGFRSAFLFQCFVESWQGQPDVSVTCVTLVGALNLCMSILAPGVTPGLPAPCLLQLRGQEAQRETPEMFTVSLAAFYSWFSSTETCRAFRADPSNPIWHIRHLFGEVLKSFERLKYIFLQLYDSGRFAFSPKSSQCHNLHGKIKSCVCATELGECAEYSLCFSASLWPFKTREWSAPTWYIVSDCQR